MVTDQIADLLIRLKTAYLSRLLKINVPYSKLKESIISFAGVVQWQNVFLVRKRPGVQFSPPAHKIKKINLWQKRKNHL